MLYISINFILVDHRHHYHHLSLNGEGHCGTTDDCTASFLQFSLFSAALWDLANSRPVHSLMLSSHHFFCLPCLLLQVDMIMIVIYRDMIMPNMIFVTWCYIRSSTFPCFSIAFFKPSQNALIIPHRTVQLTGSNLKTCQKNIKKHSSFTTFII